MGAEVHFEEDDDNISVTSTIEENVDSEEEWPVKGILAEAPVGGDRKYLVQWDGYELCDATWEPPENLTEKILAEWTEKKEQTARNRTPGFNIRVWREAAQNDIRTKFARHEARNRKRVSLGLAQKASQYTLQECLDGIGGPSGDEASDCEESGPQTNASSDEDEPLIVTISRARRQQASVNANISRSGQDDASKSFDTGTHKSTDRSEPTAARKNQEQKQSHTASAQQQRTIPSQSVGVTETAGPSPIIHIQSTADARPWCTTVRKATTPKSRKESSSTDRYAPALTSNVFVGGKVSKRRPTLLDASLDLNRNPKILKPRQQRQLEKGMRDLEGVRPPAQRPSALYSLGSGTALFASQAQAATSAADNGKLEIDTVDATNDQQLHSPEATKPRVRWSDDVTVLERSPVTAESSPFLPEDSMELEPTTNSSQENPIAAISKDTVISQHISEPTRPSITKKCRIGPEVGYLELSFTVLTSSNEPWVHQLQTCHELVFSHICTAQDIVSQAGYGASQIACLGQGAIAETEADTKTIEAISSRLHLGSMAVSCYLDGYCLLLYPSSNDEWQKIHAHDYPANIVGRYLNYSVFPPGPTFQRSMLAPVLPPAVNKLSGVAVYSEASRLFFDFEYERLLPVHNTDPGGHSFFLAFPPAAREEALLVSQWLRQHNPDCVITTSIVSGDWSSFMQLDQGTVIIHESVLWSVRLFPEFSDVLHASTGKVSTWLFCRSSNHSSCSSFDEDEDPSLGNFRLRPIFGHGLVILVTPSFLVSQPEQTYNFLKWFWQNYTKESQSYHRGRLAVASGIDEWMLSLAVEKARTGLPQCGQHISGVEDRASQARFKSWNLMRQLVMDTADGEDGPLIYGPSILDGNDEQSLVNWFGSWSILHCDEFRKFSVLGSSEQTASRLTRIVKPLRLALSSAIDINTVDDDINPQANSDMKPESQGQLHKLKAADIRKYIQDVEKNVADLTFNPVILYRFPIRYWNSDMAFSFGDYTSEFESYRSWFNFCVEPIFARVKNLRSAKLAPHFKNTSVGVFWTIQEDWDLESPKYRSTGKYRPWAAIYRPVDLHHKPWTAMELFIVDALANHEHLDRSEVYEASLIPAQRHLISFLQRESGDSTSSLPLQRVWLGGHASDQLGTLKEPLDMMLNWVGRIPTNVKGWLPPHGKELPKLGWRLIKAGQASGNRTNPPTRGDDSGCLAPNEEEDLVKVVLSPPPGDGSSRKSTWRNYLYGHIAGNLGEEKTEYTFRPTLKWYGEQLDEGRGFQHVKVTTWETVFTRYKIHDPKKV